MPRSSVRRLLIGLTATGLLGSAVAAAGPAAAEHTPAPTQVALVGDLQSELGCPGDWQPDCADTALSPGEVPGVYSGEFSLPAGAYQLKVALNGSWEENYGADGVANGSNIPLVLVEDAEIAVSYDHATHRIALAPATQQPGLTDADTALAGASLREDLTRERFYFVMADRFDNARPDNDDGGYDVPDGAEPRLVHGLDPTDKGFYHGGDIAGITRRLDYIKDMGVTAIWMTPSFKNRPVQGTGADASAGYHGYWITDFTQIDPHLGTNDELADLIDEAHARGIKVFFDIITNHTADVIDYEEGQYTYITRADEPYLDAETGQPFDDRQYAAGDTFPALDPQVSFPYTPFFPTEADETVKVPAWLNDPTLYHNRGNAAFDGTEGDEYGDFVGLDDLFTENPVVRDGMIDIYSFWAGFGIDGFRIDTVKHVNMEFWQRFAPEVLDAGVASGAEDFFMFGEVWDANPRAMSRFTTEGGLQATVDFGFQARASGFATGRPTTELRDLFAGDDYYTDADSNAYSLPTFLGNHDMGRIGMFVADAAADADEALQRDRLAHSLMYLTRGQPVVYYGDEQGFTGDGGDKDARQDMFESQVASYNDDDLLGTDATTAEENFDAGHPIYRHLADLASLRDAHPALADGAQIHRYASDAAGVYAFSRIDADEQVEYVVAANNADDARTVTFDTFNPRTTLQGLWPAGTEKVRTDDEGRVTVTVPAASAVVWRAPAALKESTSAASPYFRTPGPGGIVGGRAEVGVSVPGDGFNQVNIAWRALGTDEWTLLGTDDNAPYRVFHDVRDLAMGTMVEYRAVLKDHSGNLAVAATYATVGEPEPDDGNQGGGGPVTQPAMVTVPGTLDSELGCPGDWMPDCSQAQLTLDPDDEVWKGTFELPAGTYEYKVAIDGSWAENYGAGAVRDGANISLTLPAAGRVTFFYEHGSHWITTDVQDPIITAAGTFQSELGCPADQDPACMRAWLGDPDADGIYTFSTTGLPAGTYETKVAHGLSWDEHYGSGGTPNGSSITFAVPDGARTTFSYDIGTHVLTVSSVQAEQRPDLSTSEAYLLDDGLVAWDLPAEAAGWSFRLHHAAAGGLAVDAEAITGGSSEPLTLDPEGLPAELRDAYPELAGFDALWLSKKDAKNIDDYRTGQLAVAGYDDLGRLVAATGVQVP